MKKPQWLQKILDGGDAITLSSQTATALVEWIEGIDKIEREMRWSVFDAEEPLLQIQLDPWVQNMNYTVRFMGVSEDQSIKGRKDNTGRRALFNMREAIEAGQKIHSSSDTILKEQPQGKEATYRATPKQLERLERLSGNFGIVSERLGVRLTQIETLLEEIDFGDEFADQDRVRLQAFWSLENYKPATSYLVARAKEGMDSSTEGATEQDFMEGRFSGAIARIVLEKSAAQIETDKANMKERGAQLAVFLTLAKQDLQQQNAASRKK